MPRATPTAAGDAPRLPGRRWPGCICCAACSRLLGEGGSKRSFVLAGGAGAALAAIAMTSCSKASRSRRLASSCAVALLTPAAAMATTSANTPERVLSSPASDAGIAWVSIEPGAGRRRSLLRSLGFFARVGAPRGAAAAIAMTSCSVLVLSLGSRSRPNGGALSPGPGEGSLGVGRVSAAGAPCCTSNADCSFAVAAGWITSDGIGSFGRVGSAGTDGSSVACSVQRCPGKGRSTVGGDNTAVACVGIADRKGDRTSSGAGSTGSSPVHAALQLFLVMYTVLQEALWAELASAVVSIGFPGTTQMTGTL